MDERSGAIIEAQSLKKVYGGTTAVDGIDFQIKPGVVTGFLGPNGAGKSTTMRMILGLDLPTSGTVTVGGRRYQGRVWPLHEVGALLDARAVHPGDLTAVFGAGLYLTLVGLLGMFIGVVVRRTPAALAVLFGLLVVLPIVSIQIHGKFSSNVGEYL